MFSVVMNILCRGMQPLIIKVGIQHGHYAYILAGSTVIWLIVIFASAFKVNETTPWNVDTIGYLCMVGVGAVAAIGSLFYYKAMNDLPASLVSLCIATNPAITLVCAHWLLKERLTMGQWLGVPLVAAGVFLLLFFKETPS